MNLLWPEAVGDIRCDKLLGTDHRGRWQSCCPASRRRCNCAGRWLCSDTRSRTNRLRGCCPLAGGSSRCGSPCRIRRTATAGPPCRRCGKTGSWPSWSTCPTPPTFPARRSTSTLGRPSRSVSRPLAKSAELWAARWTGKSRTGRSEPNRLCSVPEELSGSVARWPARRSADDLWPNRWDWLFRLLLLLDLGRPSGISGSSR